MRNIFKTILVLLLTVAIIPLSACKDKAEEKTKIEGEGYASAEEAAVAYVEALCQADIDLMLSTFAIETFVENYDQKKDIERKRYYNNLMEECPLKNEGNYQEGINRYSRIFGLTYEFKKLYIELITDGEFELRATEYLKTNNEIEEFLNKINDPYFDVKISKAKIGQVLTPKMLGNRLGNIDMSIYKKITDNYNYLNCDEITSFAIEFDYESKGYYLFIDVACFDGVWYNVDMVSHLGIIVDTNTEPWSIMER